jgi:hypothetical protein
MKKSWLVLLSLGAVAACSGLTSANTPGVKTTMFSELTAAPFSNDSIARVDLHVLRVEVIQRDIDSLEAARAPDAGSNTNAENGFVTLGVPGQAIDLVTLQQGRTVKLGEAELVVGTYLGFRLILDASLSSVTLKDGTVLRAGETPGIEWPATGRVGIKLKLDQPVILTDLLTTTMLVDLNLSRLFKLRGPSISADGLRFVDDVRIAEKDSTGALSGSVRLDNLGGAGVAGARIEVLQPNTAPDNSDPSRIVRSGVTAADGTYEIRFLKPGVYNLRAVPPAALSAYRNGFEQVVVVTAALTNGGYDLVLPPS